MLRNVSTLSNNRLLTMKTLLPNKRLILQVYDCRLNSANFKCFDFYSVVCLCNKTAYIIWFIESYSANRRSFIQNNISFYSEFFSSVRTVQYSSLKNTIFISIGKKINKSQHCLIQNITGLPRTRKPLWDRGRKRDTISVQNGDVVDFFNGCSR